MSSNGKKIGLGIGILFVLWFFVAQTNQQKTGWDSFVFNITYPVLVASHSFTSYLHAMIDHRASYQELVATKALLEAQNKALLEENIKLAASVHFEARSRDLAEFQERYHFTNAMLTKVLVRNFSDEEHYFLINRGKRDGVKKDMVALYKFQIIGKVCDVFECYSKVLLVSDRSCKIAAYTNTGQNHGIICGDNKVNQCLLTYVNHLVTLVPDDLLFSSGQGLVFPEGYCLGKIESCKAEDLYQQAVITPLVDFTKLEFCLLIGQEDIPAL